MLKKMTVLLFLTLMFFSLIGCGNEKENEQIKNGNNKPIQREEEPYKDDMEDPIEKQIAGMTLDEKIGQMFIVGFEDYVVTPQTKTLLERYQVGGLIFYSKNIKDANQLLELTNELKAINTQNKIPLFLSIDEEGGRVSRLDVIFEKLPTNREIGKANNPEYSYEIGRLLGQELKAFGFNMNFAPVLDIDSNPDNPVIGDRSFGPNAEIVTELGIKTMKGIQSTHVISVVKHFPGHGDTAVDSHVGLPQIDKDLNSLRSLELIPFKKAIENHSDGIMVGHILLPEIDNHYPASLSKRIITDILREEMKYDGVVMTDDLTMGAITEVTTIQDATIQSVLAGNDIILICHNYNKQVTAIEGLKVAVKSGMIPEKQIDESVYRILKLKEKYGVKDEEIEGINIEGLLKMDEQN